MACSCSNAHVTLEVGEEEHPYPYPYPSNLSITSFVTLKLSGRDKYAIWKRQMLCLLKSHEMVGFIDGTFVRREPSDFGKEKVGDYRTHRLWTRSDALVQGWILGSLSDQTLGYVLKRLTDRVDFSAKDVWDELHELHTMYGGTVLPKQPIDQDTISSLLILGLFISLSCLFGLASTIASLYYTTVAAEKVIDLLNVES